MPPTYSIVIPAYNESARLGASLEKVLAYVHTQRWDAEVIVVNDGSRDNTAEIVLNYMLQGLPGALDVGTAGARQSGDDGAADDFGDRLHRLEIAIRGDGESGLDDVHAEAIELMGQAQFFLLVHAAAGGLLAISESGVKYSNSRFIHNHFL